MIPLLFLLLAASDPGGYLGARWGMTPDQVLAAVPQAERNTESDAVKPFRETLTPIIIKEVTIAGDPMRVSFRFGEQSGRLEDVLVEATREIDKRPADFDRIESLLVEKYGRPWTSSSPEERTSRWTLDTTTVELQLRTHKAIGLSFLTILYQPRKTDAPI
jgi:hypothetical protein